MKLYFSIIIPVYNRPEELRELLQSLQSQEYTGTFEVVIVEDGSTESAEAVVKTFQNSLQISYYYKENSGPGDSRNYGMQRAKGNYFILLDSDCILPKQYITEVYKALQTEFVPCFGGPDTAAPSFTTLQKAINHVMTSFYTTGGIRGGKKAVDQFQPRSFNMGIAKEVFEHVGGFSHIHPGEDPDLTFRIWKAGYTSRLFPEAFVFHKRRLNWSAFYHQMKKFGMARSILNQWHPDTARATYWFPTLFTAGLLLSLFLALAGIVAPLGIYMGYFVLVFFEAWIKNKAFTVAVLTIFAALVQFTGYGIGFFTATTLLSFSKEEPEKRLPHLFFTTKKRLKKPGKGFNKRKIQIFSFFLVCSSLAWLLSNLSKSYEASTALRLTYKNVPDTLLLSKNAAHTLEVTLKTSGFQFLYYHFIQKSVSIDVSQVLYHNEHYSITKAVLRKQIERQLPKNIVLLDVDRDALAVDVYRITSKNVPIQAHTVLSFQQNYIVEGTPKITPSHVTVKGPKREVDCITVVRTAPIPLDHLSSDFSRNVGLVFPEHLENSIFSIQKVNVSGKMVKFSEKVFQVPLQTVNFPEGYHVETFPNTIPVLCKATAAQLKVLTPADFNVIADYKQINGANTNTLLLEITQAPQNVYDVRLLESTATFILEQL